MKFSAEILTRLCMAIVITLCGSSAALASNGDLEFYVTDSQNGRSPSQEARNSFSCEDQVFTVIRASEKSDKALKVVVTWTDPLGKERERSNFRFMPREGGSRTWSWLKLHRGAGATVMSMFDSAAGLSEFIGQWTVEIAMDGKHKKTLHFDVLC